jgi:hypothetical protein
MGECEAECRVGAGVPDHVATRAGQSGTRETTCRSSSARRRRTLREGQMLNQVVHVLRMKRTIESRPMVATRFVFSLRTQARLQVTKTSA